MGVRYSQWVNVNGLQSVNTSTWYVHLITPMQIWMEESAALPPTARSLLLEQLKKYIVINNSFCILHSECSVEY